MPLSQMAKALFVGVLLALASSACAGRELRQAAALAPSIRNLGAEIQSIIFNELRGDNNYGRNSIYAELASTKAGQLISNLQAELSVIISNVIVGNDNIAENLVSVLMANRALIERLELALEAYAINDISGDFNEVSNMQWYDLVGENAGNNILKDLFVEISGLTYNKVGDLATNLTGNSNQLSNTMGVFAGLGDGERPTIPEAALMNGTFNPGNVIPNLSGLNNIKTDNVSIIIDAILLNEVISGDNNYLENFLTISVANGVEMTNVKADIEAILVNQVEGAGNRMSNVLDIVLGLCDGAPCSLSDFELTVSSILLNDVQGQDNVLDNTVKIIAATNSGILATESLEAVKKATVDIETIIVNTLRSDLLDVAIDSNKLKNDILIEVLNRADVEDVRATVSAIIANEITDRKSVV